METYITAELELVDMDEDVIAASPTSVTCCSEFTVNTTSGPSTYWTVYYDNGEVVNYSGDLPSDVVCP